MAPSRLAVVQAHRIRELGRSASLAQQWYKTSVSIRSNPSRPSRRSYPGDRLPWPEAAYALLDELRESRGRIAFVVGDAASDVARRIAEAWGTEVMCVGKVLTSADRPPTREDVLRAMEAAEVFDEIEILFSPELALDPIDAFRSLARMRPRLCVWPGTIAGRRAAFSLPGREDRCDEQIADVVVLRARDTAFPDETPFEVERIP